MLDFLVVQDMYHTTETAQKVRVASRRGQLIATAFITHTVQTGQVFIPMHYASLNQLTLSAFDPYSRHPAYKACAVSVTPQEANRE